MSRRICPFCGEPVPAPVLVCPHCGRRIELPVVVFFIGAAVAVSAILYVVWFWRR